MAAAYTREFLIEVYMGRMPPAARELAETFYDKVGKDEFRKYASINPAAVRAYKAGKRGYDLYLAGHTDS